MTIDEIAALLRQGLTNTAIAQQLPVSRQQVAQARRDLRIPDVPRQKSTLEEKWGARTQRVEGGHIMWTGERSASGSMVFWHCSKSYTAHRVAFLIKHGRWPVGVARTSCAYRGCVAPDHTDDEVGRRRTYEQLRYIAGYSAPPATCVHGHDQGEHGAFTAEGHSFCRRCQVAHNRKAKERRRRSS
ncbi:hypothetical protein AB0K71_06050 [Streptomyces syringium]|uniref:hypothetical protein n=1 Tax=Streptomyces syringium TaxID=76729 RepID=UPI0034185572